MRRDLDLLGGFALLLAGLVTIGWLADQPESPLTGAVPSPVSLGSCLYKKHPRGGTFDCDSGVYTYDSYKSLRLWGKRPTLGECKYSGPGHILCDSGFYSFTKK